MKLLCATVLAIAMAISVTALAQSGPNPSGIGSFINELNQKSNPPSKGDIEKGGQEQNKQFDKSISRNEETKKKFDTPDKMLKDGNDLFKKLKDFNEMNEAFDKLSQQDGPWDPDYTPPGSPEVPTSCPPKGECGPCYEKAYGDLTAVRIRLEKLRVLYGSTNAWVTKALAFGDGASGVSGYAALAWQTERRKIEQSVKRLERNYDSKYAELMTVLQDSLNEIGDCEARFHDNPDWYNRFGYMFHTFMADRYRR
jgi:hypothetical protein